MPHPSFLIPCGGGDPIPLQKAKIVIGRNNDCDVVVRFATVSGHHCQLEWQQNCSRWLVRDLASHNGTRVDGIPCDTKLLPPGSVLWVASVRYQVIYGSPKPHTAARLRGPIFAQSLLQAAGLERWQSDDKAEGERKTDH
jgi:pSer/pThr/pTyr-binding forkhead associated (FHA) protein